MFLFFPLPAAVVVGTVNGARFRDSPDQAWDRPDQTRPKLACLSMAKPSQAESRVVYTSRYYLIGSSVEPRTTKTTVTTTTK